MKLFFGARRCGFNGSNAHAFGVGFAILLQQGDYTADEIAAMVRKSILSVRPRISELNTAGMIWDSGERRKNASGNPMIVWTTKKQGKLL
jgi:predicted ArsR family transcriptional regulator